MLLYEGFKMGLSLATFASFLIQLRKDKRTSKVWLFETP